MNRHLFVASSLAALGLAGCGTAKNALTNGPFRQVLLSAEKLEPRRDRHARPGARVPRPRRRRELPRQRPGHAERPDVHRAAHDGFRGYSLVVDGLVERPQKLSLAALRAAGDRTQITRHDCVEGWSAIGKWRGVPLATVLAMAQPKPNARYCIFRCYDADQSGTQYYESLDLVQAAHPQTLLALDLNDKPLDPDHGAPVRLSIPTQLGYKSAKWVGRIELAAERYPGARRLLGRPGLRVVRRHLA